MWGLLGLWPLAVCLYVCLFDGKGGWTVVAEGGCRDGLRGRLRGRVKGARGRHVGSVGDMGWDCTRFFSLVLVFVGYGRQGALVGGGGHGRFLALTQWADLEKGGDEVGELWINWLIFLLICYVIFLFSMFVVVSLMVVLKPFVKCFIITSDLFSCFFFAIGFGYFERLLLLPLFVLLVVSC